MSLASRILDVKARLKAAAQACGRDPAEVTLVAITKKQSLEAVMEAYDAGIVDLGENTMQGLITSAEALGKTGRKPRWHFVGHLQRNKIAKLLPHVELFHTVDRQELAKALADKASQKPLDYLIQVNIGLEPQKGGLAPEAVLDFAREISGLPNIRLKGLMAIPPYETDPRSHFETMRRLSQELRALRGCQEAKELSMGMSDDFEAAIGYGATIIRVGTAIFGERQKR